MAGYAGNPTFPMAKQLNVSFNLDGVIREDKDTNCFVSYCPALDLYSAGRTRPEARAALQSAIDLFVRLGYERNILGRLLHDKGFEPLPVGALLPELGADARNTIVITEDARFETYDDTFKVTVPLNLIAAAAAGSTQVPTSCRPQ